MDHDDVVDRGAQSSGHSIGGMHPVAGTGHAELNIQRRHDRMAPGEQHDRPYATDQTVRHDEDAPWPATKDELIDYAIRSGAPMEVIENLQELEDEGEVYESIEDIWPDYPSQEDFMFNEDEY